MTSDRTRTAWLNCDDLRQRCLVQCEANSTVTDLNVQ